MKNVSLKHTSDSEPKIYYNVRCCIYFMTYDWIKSSLKIRVEDRAIYGNLENKINTLYWPVENSIPKNNDRRQSHIWKSRE